MKTTAERFNEAVYKHRFLWTEVLERVMKNTPDITKEDAEQLICNLIEKRSISFLVAGAILDMIIEKNEAPQCS